MLRLSWAWVEQDQCQDPFRATDGDGPLLLFRHCPCVSPRSGGVGSVCPASSLSVSPSFFVSFSASRVSAPGYSPVLALISFNCDVIVQPPPSCAPAAPSGPLQSSSSISAHSHPSPVQVPSGMASWSGSVQPLLSLSVGVTAMGWEVVFIPRLFRKGLL